MRTAKLLVIVVAGCLAALAASRADANGIITVPTPAYLASTTLLSLSGLEDGDEVVAVSDGALTVSFSSTMMRLTVPDTWGTWNTPPFTESAQPAILWSEGATSVHMSLSAPQRVFGFEAQPDLSDVEALSAAYFDADGNLLGELVRHVSGNGGALLFAAIWDVPVASVVFSDLADEDFAIANLRYGSAFVVPSPGSGALVATGLLLLWLLRTRRVAVATPGCAPARSSAAAAPAAEPFPLPGARPGSARPSAPSSSRSP
jgi:hypothetical protein